ncbi:Glucose/arabinose dehydrogenase, beta-propeller fold [Gracilibacillus orientalis]|uniref:Glucose/arabinose dehydrogenase, beta-propeller fold n=1 Tax=Gracilibacillus orientalis TaxID=334253 RepID=A0A1I4H052_9BACI|nr:sorbosone dehydrogenase family protein [Gracilibacillus orientalis]SFL35712.1 Glucose/arabinose dehydrogenase, beta-propeller fold [Gracilibacillus orientalis]
MLSRGQSVLLLILFFATACSTDEQPKSIDEQPSNSSELGNKDQSEIIDASEEQEVIAEDLNVPWAIEKIEDTFYLTERPGNIVKIENGEVERQSVELEKELATAAEAGLLGFALDQDFSESNLAYAYYTYRDDTGQFNRIVTLRLDGNIWTEEELLLDKIPSGSYHHGGRLKIGPDDKLYATAGDASDADIAQNNESLGGKILRMNLDGSIPSDNPFEDSYVYSLGHRNPQGITWAEDGTLYASEHGNSANDEVNQIEAGQNYGWPIIEGKKEQEGMITPLFTSGADTTWAPSGIDYHRSKLYVAALRGTALLEFDLETGDQSEVISDLGRIRDVVIDEEILYFITNNTDGRGNPEDADDKLYKISLSDLN